MNPESNAVDTVDLQPKPMAGKYDGRKKNGATKARRRLSSNLGRKPKWMKHLSRNAAHDMLKQFDSIASPAEIYAWCWEHKKIDLMVGMREYVWNRLEGRPFIAQDPKANKKPNVLEDKRLQIAIKELHIGTRAVAQCTPSNTSRQLVPKTLAASSELSG